MLELMGKMALCLIGVLLLGFLLGWLFSRALKEEEKFVEIEVENDPEELEAKLEQIEKLYTDEKSASDEYAKRNEDLKSELMKKMTELDAEVKKVKLLEEESSGVNNHRQEIRELKELLTQKDAELREFETVLVKAEETIEVKEAYITQLLGK